MSGEFPNPSGFSVRVAEQTGARPLTVVPAKQEMVGLIGGPSSSGQRFPDLGGAISDTTRHMCRQGGGHRLVLSDALCAALPNAAANLFASADVRNADTVTALLSGW